MYYGKWCVQVVKLLMLKNNIDEIATDLNDGRLLYLFGAGNTCRDFLHKFSCRDKVECIFDNDKAKLGQHIDGKLIKHSEEICDLIPENSIFLITTYYANEIKEQLEKLGMKNIFHFYSVGFNCQDTICHDPFDDVALGEVHKVKSYMADEISKSVIERIIAVRQQKQAYFGYGYSYDAFFCREILRFCPYEIVVDGGAFNGDTIELYKRISGDKYNRIYAFEPDEKNFSDMYDKFKCDDKIKCIKAGLWSQKDILRFNSSNDVAAKLDEGGDTIVNVKSIDEYIDDEVTFIKMDIEGAELEALLGAQKTILKYKPKLAISIYHKSDDLWKIPLWIKNLVPEYKFYIRHHSYAMDDTVLYACLD